MRPEAVGNGEDRKGNTPLEPVQSRKAVLYAIYRFGTQRLEVTVDALAYVLQKAGYVLTLSHVRAYLAEFARETLGEFDGEVFVPIEDFDQEIEDRGWKDLPFEKRKNITMSQVELGRSTDIEAALERWKTEELHQFLGVKPEAIISNAVRLEINLPERGTVMRIDMGPALRSKYEPTMDTARQKVLEDLQNNAPFGCSMSPAGSCQ
jgi:hypothetical protein